MAADAAVMVQGRSHLLECQHDGCDYVVAVRAGDLPLQCPIPKGGCGRDGFWQISRIYIWNMKDLRVLRALGISPD